MVKCSFCEKEAVYINRVSNLAYCKKHFLEYFDRKVRRMIRKYKMLGPREHIVVAVSGGKDSNSLLYYLYNLSRKARGWEVSALLIDEGIKSYREYTVRDFKKLVEKLGVDYRIVSFKEYFGYTLDEIVEIGRSKNLPYLPCSYCGVLRRYLLNRVAREMGATVLATAHNLDDVVQTFIMNVMRNSWDKIARLGPVTGIAEHPKFVKRVKPFIELLDKETTIYALINGLITPEFKQCPYIVYNVRAEIRSFLNKIEEKQPGTKYSLLRSMLTIIDFLSKHKSELVKGEVMECRICGEPSSHPVCRACYYKLRLGIAKSEELELFEKIASTVSRLSDLFED